MEDEERGNRKREYDSHPGYSPKTRDRKYGSPVGSDDDEKKKDEKKELPNFGLSGALATDEVTGMFISLLSF